MHDHSFLKRLSDSIMAPFRRPTRDDQSGAAETQQLSAPRRLFDSIRTLFRRPAGEEHKATGTQHHSAPRDLFDSIRASFRRPAGEEQHKTTETQHLSSPRSLFDVIRTPFWRLAADELAMPVHRFVAVWIALAGYASITEPRGRIAGRTLREIDVLYHLDKGSTARILAFLEEHGLVADGAIADPKAPRGFHAYDVCTDPFWLLAEDELGMPVDMSVALWTAFQGYAERGEPYGRIADRALREIDLLYRLDRGTAARVLTFLEGHGLVQDGTVAWMTKNSRTAGTRGRKDNAGSMDNTAQASPTAAAAPDDLPVVRVGEGSAVETGAPVPLAVAEARSVNTMAPGIAGSLPGDEIGDGATERLSDAAAREGAGTGSGAGAEELSGPAGTRDIEAGLSDNGAEDMVAASLTHAGTAGGADAPYGVDAGTGERVRLAGSPDDAGPTADPGDHEGAAAAASPAAWSMLRTAVPHARQDHARPKSLHC